MAPMVIAVLCLCFIQGSLSQTSTTLAPPIYAGDCPFFKATSVSVLGPSPPSNFNFVSNELNSSKPFNEVLYYNQEAIHGRVVDYYVTNVSASVKGSCLSCLDNTCDKCDVDIQLGSGGGAITIPGPLTRVILPLYVYVVELYCVLKHSKSDLKSDALPRGNISLGSTCDFTHVRPGQDYIFVGSLETGSNFRLRMKYAYQATPARVQTLRELCGFRTPVLSPILSNSSMCATEGASSTEGACVKVSAAASPQISALAYLFVMAFFAVNGKY
ncbi:uncharacterized protein LOC106179308 [Lingula anatina]|uniref:Uncharacterized protein LOC106179308 n=1 Tax=Lingula anatina TaxID=7574 RepID=A0A1S3K760_LINAN|nr:uncharacterized protein LOC106179308 [Lingula anatina]XP_013418333.1 uncharacterized protein LOC106179308 [Lingula anatina]|eukprot:XP_013418332.1 uncharacterized protein LOC106179308 [Lingula anatina]